MSAGRMDDTVVIYIKAFNNKAFNTETYVH